MPLAQIPPGVPFGPDHQIRALIGRHGYANGVTREVERILRRGYKAVQQRLLTTPPSSGSVRDLQDFLAYSAERITEVTDEARRASVQRLGDAGQAEAEGARVHGNALRTVFGQPSRTQLVSMARYTHIVDTLDVGGVGFGEWWQDSAKAALRRVKTAVQDGMVRGENPHAIARTILNTRGRSVAGMQVAQARTLVRTALTAVQNAAALEEIDMLVRDVNVPIGRVRFEAVLDVRTSDVCRALDGEEYDPRDPKLPRPPLHPNCRSVLVPVIDPEALGLPKETGAREQSYDQWLRAQPPKVQDAVLGSSRAAMWRAGDVSLADMIAEDRTSLTVAQLRARLTRPPVPPVPVVPVTPPVPVVVVPPPPPSPPVDPLDKLRTLADDERAAMGLRRGSDTSDLRASPFGGDPVPVEQLVDKDPLAAHLLRTRFNASTPLPVESVRLDTLQRRAAGLLVSELRPFLDRPVVTRLAGEAMPRMVRFNGKLHVVTEEAHLAAQFARGVEEVEAYVLDLDVLLLDARKPTVYAHLGRDEFHAAVHAKMMDVKTAMMEKVQRLGEQRIGAGLRKQATFDEMWDIKQRDGESLADFFARKQAAREAIQKSQDEFNAIVKAHEDAKRALAGAYREAVSDILAQAAEEQARLDGATVLTGKERAFADIAPPANRGAASRERNTRTQQAMDYIAKIMPRRASERRAPAVRVNATRGHRSFYDAGAINMSRLANDGVYVHELMHFHEDLVSRQFARFGVWWRDSRRTSTTTRNMRGYKRWEWFYPGDYPLSKYMGKEYGSSSYATEVVTMGFEWLQRDPGHLATVDPEFFKDLIDFIRRWRTWTPPTR